MKARAFKGDDGKSWGVEQGGGLIYEADFSQKIARRIAQLLNRKTPPVDWERTREILIAEGYSPEEWGEAKEAR